MLGSRAIYHDGWKAVAFHPVGPLYDDGLSVNAPFDEDVWELYHVAEDPSEVQRPCHGVPGQGGRAGRTVVGRGAAQRRACRSTTGSWKRSPTPSPITDARGTPSGTSRAAPRCRSRWRSSSATGPTPSPSPSTCPTATVPNGVLLALGCALGGWSLHVVDGQPALRPQPVRQDPPRPAAERADRFRTPHRASSRFEPDGSGGGPASAAPRREGGGRGTDRPIHACRLQRGRDRRHLWVRVGSGSGRRLLRPVPVQWEHRARRGHHHGPAVLNPALEIAAILAKQ